MQNPQEEKRFSDDLKSLIKIIDEIEDYESREKFLLEEFELKNQILDAATDSIFLHDFDGNFIYVNETAYKTHGYLKDELMKLNLRDLDVPEYADLIEYRIKDLMNIGEATFESAHFRKDGSIMPVEVHASIIKSGDKKYVLSVSRDITRRKLAEAEKFKALAEAAAAKTAENIINQMSDSVVILDKSGKISSFNQAFGKLSGYGKEAIGKVPMDLAPDEEKENVTSTLRKARNVSQISNFETLLKTKDGNLIPVLINAKLYQDDFGMSGLIVVLRDISDFKLISDALKKSENLLKSFFNAITESAFMIDAKGNYLMVNDALTHNLGRSREELVGNNAFQFLPEEVVSRRMENLNRVVKLKKALIFEDEREGIYLQNHLYPIHGADGEIDRIVIFSMDVTELKVAEKSLKESEERYRAIIEDSPDMVLIYGDTGIIFSNPAALKIFKAKKISELEGLTLEDFVLPEYLGRLNKRVENAKKHHKKNEPIESKIWDLEGNIITLETASVPIILADKTAVQIVGRDITARKEAIEALRESNHFIKNVLASMMDGFSVLDEHGVHVRVNDALCQITGFSSDELIGSGPPHLYWPEEEYENIKKAFNRTINGKTTEFELVFKRKNGERFPVLVSPSVITDEKGNIINAVATVKDISRRKEAEELVKRKNLILEGINQVFENALIVENEEDLLIKSLEVCEAITNSQFGFILEINRKGNLDTIAMSNPGWKECLMRDSNVLVMLKDMKNHGLYAKASRDDKPFFTNDPAHNEDSVGTPLGHPEIQRFLGVPLRQAGEVIGSIGLANKEIEYNMDDLEIVDKLSIAISESLMRKRAENSLKVALDERELLLKEIHHRVKNNLIIISSLLNLQSHELKDAESIEMFKESQLRAKSMALIHERLYQSTDLKNINFTEYIQHLANDIYKTYVPDPGRIQLAINTEDINIDINTAIPLGLILNELITNSIKHGFPDSKRGTISINFYKEDGNFKLMVKDDGVGFPDYLDFEKADSLGLQLINTLVNQIDGTITLEADQGTKFIISFSDTFEN